MKLCVGDCITVYGLLSSGRARISEKSGFMEEKIDKISAINVSDIEYTILNNVVDLSMQRYSVFPK